MRIRRVTLSGNQVRHLAMRHDLIVPRRQRAYHDGDLSSAKCDLAQISN
jgi:hypothetical protein